jgi:hypothetical protein
MRQISTEYLHQVYSSSDIPVIESTASENVTLNGIWGYFSGSPRYDEWYNYCRKASSIKTPKLVKTDQTSPYIVVRRSLPNKKKLTIFYHEYGHYVQYLADQDRRSADIRESDAEIYVGKQLLLTKCHVGLEYWASSSYYWWRKKRDWAGFSSDIIAQRIIRSNIWLKVAHFLRDREMIRCRKIAFQCLP